MAPTDVLSDEAGRTWKNTVDKYRHTTELLLMNLKIEHAYLDAMADKLAQALPVEALIFKGLKKRYVLFRDRISLLESSLLFTELA